jgi:hypothetical protein
LTASDTNPPCGATITLTGTNFLPNSTVTIQARAAQFQVGTDAQGNFSTPFTLPGHPCKGDAVVPVAGLSLVMLTLRKRAQARRHRRF